MLLVLVYILPTLLIATMSAAIGPKLQSSMFTDIVAFIAILIIVIVPPVAIGLSLWHLISRRRIGECLAALVLALPIVFLWVSMTRRAMVEARVQQAVQADAHASEQ
jgi:ABC-type molybdate transport system permease subunit